MIASWSKPRIGGVTFEERLSLLIDDARRRTWSKASVRRSALCESGGLTTRANLRVLLLFLDFDALWWIRRLVFD